MVTETSAAPPEAGSVDYAAGALGALGAGVSCGTWPRLARTNPTPSTTAATDPRVHAPTLAESLHAGGGEAGGSSSIHSPLPRHCWSGPIRQEFSGHAAGKRISTSRPDHELQLPYLRAGPEDRDYCPWQASPSTPPSARRVRGYQRPARRTRRRSCRSATLDPVGGMTGRRFGGNVRRNCVERLRGNAELLPSGSGACRSLPEALRSLTPAPSARQATLARHSESMRVLL